MCAKPRGPRRIERGRKRPLSSRPPTTATHVYVPSQQKAVRRASDVLPAVAQCRLCAAVHRVRPPEGVLEQRMR